ncbi:MAG: FAD-binding protein, partial [Acidobacteria bacterium]|nr:FAD-binding protein [Acidobacteriota bacterium]
EHIRKKLPSMYHQFKQLAGIDITEEPMEVGPTTHYVMGGVRVDPDTQMSTVPGLFAAGECAAGLHGANRLGGNSLSDLLVFGQRAGQYAAEFAKGQTLAKPAQYQIEAVAREALAPFERAGGDAEGPYQVQYDLQDMMQSQVGIVRTEDDMQKAIDAFAGLRARADRVGVQGNREYNSGWHTAIDLRNLLMVSEAVARSAILRKESRGAHFREDHLEKDPEQGRLNTVIRRGEEGEMQVTQEPISEVRPDLQQIIEDNK